MIDKINLYLFKFLIYSALFVALLCFPSCAKHIETIENGNNGVLSISYNTVTVDNNIVSLKTKSVVIPNIQDFNLEIKSSTGEVCYSGAPITQDLLLNVGSYKVNMSYGSDYINGELIHSNLPFFSYSNDFNISVGNKTTLPISPKFAGSVLLIKISEDLLKHYESYEIKLEGVSGSTPFSTTLTNNSQLFVKPGVSVNISLEGINKVGENISSVLFTSSSLTGGVLADVTEYIVNVNDNSPQFSLPTQNDLRVWSYTANFTPLTEQNFSRGNATELLPKIVYELVDGNNIITGNLANGEVNFTNLNPSTQYTYRARYKGVISTNIFSFNTESAEQLMYSNMDTWATGDSGGQPIYYPNATANNSHWATRSTQTMSSGVNAWYTRCPVVRQTSDSYSGSAATITTVGWGSGNTWAGLIGTAAIYNISSGWLVYGDINTSGVITKNRTINARPDNISFYYKYVPKAGSAWNITVEVLAGMEVIGSASSTYNVNVSSYTKINLDINYTNLQKKATGIYVFFTNRIDDIKSKDHISKLSNPNRYEGALLYIDEIQLNYIK